MLTRGWENAVEAVHGMVKLICSGTKKKVATACSISRYPSWKVGAEDQRGWLTSQSLGDMYVSERRWIRNDGVRRKGPLRLGVWGMSRTVAAVENVGQHLAFLADVSVGHAFQARDKSRVLDLDGRRARSWDFVIETGKRRQREGLVEAGKGVTSKQVPPTKGTMGGMVTCHIRHQILRRSSTKGISVCDEHEDRVGRERGLKLTWRLKDVHIEELDLSFPSVSYKVLKIPMLWARGADQHFGLGRIRLV
jgi:hypothetical protein